MTPNLTTPTLDIPRAEGSHAIVIGGGITGLMAARVLSDYVQRVTIVERDRLPAGSELRKGAPQANHTHFLMIRGRQILEQLFPGFAAEMIAAGAWEIDLAADMLWINRMGITPRFQSGLKTLFCSRNLLEWGMRRRLAGLGKISFVEVCDVLGLLSTPDKTSVTGVQVRYRDHLDDPARATGQLQADLVVDTSGYSSRAPQWLEALGYTPPPPIVVKPFRGYASRYYAIPPQWQADWQVLVVQSKPPLGTRYGQLFPIEGNRWMLTLIGAAHDYPPTDEEGLLAFARSLPSPLIYEAIKDAQPVSPIYGYQHTENRLHAYEQMDRWPDGFIALGDAVCTLNPSYAQGITAAGLGALTLDRCLQEQPWRGNKRDLAGLARRFQQALAITNAPLWLKSISDDLRYAKTEGAQRSRKMQFLHWYIDQTLQLATESRRAYVAFMSWMQLLKPLESLFQPRLMVHVLWSAFSRRAANVARRQPPISERVSG